MFSGDIPGTSKAGWVENERGGGVRVPRNFYVSDQLQRWEFLFRNKWKSEISEGEEYESMNITAPKFIPSRSH